MSGQGRGNYVRRQGLKRKRLTKAEMARKAYPSQARGVVSQAGVPGAKAQMTMGIQPKQEMKTLDVSISHNPLTGDWSYPSSAGLASIRSGAGNGFRVGRSIRLMGVCVRATVNTPFAATSPIIGQPYSMHLIKDTQCNGNVPGTSTVYQTTNRNSLPNTLYLQRFQWLHSVERQGQQTANSMVSFTYNCNILINYDLDNGLISDVERNNILLAFSADTSTPTINGVIRFNYVDA